VHGSAPVHAFSFQSVFFGSCSYWLLHLTHSCSLNPFATAGEPIPCREKHHPNPGEHFPGRENIRLHLNYHFPCREKSHPKSGEHFPGWENVPQLLAKQFRARNDLPGNSTAIFPLRKQLHVNRMVVFRTGKRAELLQPHAAASAKRLSISLFSIKGSQMLPAMISFLFILNGL